MFELDGNQYTLEQVQAAAYKSGMMFDDYVQKYKFKELGKTTPTSPGADVEETAAPELTVTESPSVDISLESPQTGTTDSTLITPPRKKTPSELRIDATRKSMAMANPIASIMPDFMIPVLADWTAMTTELGAGVVDTAEILYELGLSGISNETFDRISREQRIDMSEVYEGVDALRNIREKKYDEQGNELDAIGLWQAGRKSESAQQFISEAIGSLPSTVLSYIIPGGGSAIIGIGTFGSEFERNLKERPEETGMAMLKNAFIKGSAEAVFELLGGKTFKTLTKAASKGMTEKAVKEMTRTGIPYALRKILGITGQAAIEAGTEALTGVTQLAADEMFFDDEIEAAQYWRTIIHSGVVGGLMGGGITAGTVGTQVALTGDRKKAAMAIIAPKEWRAEQKEISRNIDRAARDYQNAPDNKKAYFKNKIEVLEQRLNGRAERLAKVWDGLTRAEKIEYARLVDETNSQLDIIGNAKYTNQAQKEAQILLDGAYSEMQAILGKDNINIEDEQALSRIIKSGVSIAEAVGVAKKVLKNINIQNISNEVFQQVSKAVTGKKSASDAIFFDGNNIFINKDISAATEQTNVLGHELLHYVMAKRFNVSDESLGPLVNSFKDYLKQTQPEILERIEQRLEKAYEGEAPLEEYLNLFSDIIAREKIIVDESITDKIKNSATRLLNSFGFGSVKLETGKDVFDFLRNYTKNVNNLKFKQLGIDITSDKIGKAIQKDVRESKSVASEKVQEIYEAQGAANAMDIIDEFRPITNKIVNRYKDVPGFEFQLLRDEIETGKRGILDMIMSYTPEKAKGAPLAGFINKFLPARAIEAANRILNTEFTLDVTEAKGITDTATEETIEAADEAKIADEIKSLRKEIGLPEELVNAVKNAVIKTFGTKLPNPQDPKFRLELQRRFRIELKKPLAKFVGKQADYESFLRNNFQSIYNKLPQSLINRRFKDFQEPVLDKNGKHVREKTAEGNKVYTKKKITPAEWVKYFLGTDVGRSTQGTRKTAIVEAVAEEIAFDATMEILQSPDVINKYQDIAGITGEVLPENFKAIIAKQIDRAEDFKFSKSLSNIAKEEYNLEQQELARILDKNNLNSLSNKYSLLSDNIIYEADPANIKFSLTTKADGKWTADQLNPLDESRGIYKFKVGEIDYEINAFKDPLNYNYDIFEQTEGIEDGAINNDPKSWGMTFASATTQRVNITGYALKGLTNQFKVLGTVANATIDLIKKEKLNSITFTAKEESRKRLYRSLNQKFANELGWKTYDYQATVPDGSETIFIAYNPKAFNVEPQITTPPPIRFSNSNSKFNVTAKKLLTPQGWAEWSNANYEGAKVLQDKIGNIKTKLGSQRPSYIISEKRIKGFDKLTNKEKQILREKINNLKESIIAYEAKTDFNILKPKESFGNPAKKFGRNATEIFNNIKNGNIFKLQNTYSRIYDNMWEKYYDILEEDSNMFDFLESTLQTSNDDVSHWHRLGATFLGFDPTALEDFLTDKNGNKILKTIYTKQGKKQIPIVRTFEYEHAVQNHIQWKRVLDAAKRFAKNKNKKGFLDYLKKSKENYVLIAMSITDSKKINEAGYAHVMPKNWKKWVDRYIASNIDLNKIVYINYSNNNATIDGNIASNFVTRESKSLNRDFNKILEQSTGIDWKTRFSPVQARIMGKGKGKKFFIPYSADDFVGLLYTTLADKKVGEQQMEWYKENLLRPFSRGIQQYEAAKQKALREWQILKKEAKKDVPGGLDKKNATGLTNQDAVRLYIWRTQGMEIPGVKGGAAFVNENLKIVRKNPELKAFAERLMALNPEGYPEPATNWDSGDITTDIVSYINNVKRSEFLTEWKENVDEIFSDQNKEKLRALYGDNYIEALEDILYRMRTGTNRKFGISKVERQFMDWTNNSVGAIMFFNARSAVLQTLSAVNFINFTDNNPINAGVAFFNQKQYWNDFSELFNSDFLKQRRSGLQTDVNADEIARAAKGAKNTARAVLSALLKFGFTPTQIADSFAIASGGATFYRNRIKTYLKEGMSEQDAKAKAFTDFQEIAEETQQSARPDRISLQQASSLGRLILAFGNTPMQYARLTKKATLDLINGRGDWKTNMSKIMYYSVIQNIIFSALQQGLFALLFDDEDDDKQKSRLFRIGNSSLDTLLRGVGVYGAAAATLKNMVLEIIDQQKSGRPDYSKIAIEATAISPPINSKLRKLESAGKTFTYKQSKEKVFTEGFSLENPAFLAGGKVISALTNLPADRVVQKADHIYTAMQPETELWQSIALSLGWSEWDLNMIENKTPQKNLTTKQLQNLMKRNNNLKKLMKRK